MGGGEHGQRGWWWLGVKRLVPPGAAGPWSGCVKSSILGRLSRIAVVHGSEGRCRDGGGNGAGEEPKGFGR